MGPVINIPGQCFDRFAILIECKLSTDVQCIARQCHETGWVTFKCSVTGQVERMNRTIKGATVHYDNHDQLRCHLSDVLNANNYARRLKTLDGLTPYENICKIWTSEADRFILNPIHLMPELNN